MKMMMIAATTTVSNLYPTRVLLGKIQVRRHYGDLLFQETVLISTFIIRTNGKSMKLEYLILIIGIKLKPPVIVRMPMMREKQQQKLMTIRKEVYYNIRNT